MANQDDFNIGDVVRLCYQKLSGSSFEIVGHVNIIHKRYIRLSRFPPEEFNWTTKYKYSRILDFEILEPREKIAEDVPAEA